MSANLSESKDASVVVPVTPKRITNAQTVCNEKNEKGKLCNGHLKQLRTAGEAAEVHLRGDDVLSKCQTCGTLYMGPPLGHVRDPQKQHRFVEAELTALLQAAGGTLPVIKKNESGVFVIVEPEQDAKPVAAPATATKSAAAAPVAAAPATATPPVPKPAAAKAPGHKAQPNRALFKRFTYAGVVDSGPIPGETFERKVERLRKVSAAAKQRADDGGAPPSAAVESAVAPTVESAAPEALVQAEAAAPAAAPPAPTEAPATSAPAHAKSGQPDRTLMKRFTYCGVVDSGPVPGETFEQKVERLRAVSAAAKQRAEEGGGN